MNNEISKFISGGTEHTSGVSVLLLHGYGADERDLPELMSFLPDLPWFSPRAPLSAAGGFSWYSTANLLEPTVEELADVTEALWNWIEQHIPEDQKLMVLGFSQGGLMATQLLRTRPERIAGTVILSGFLALGDLPKDSELQITRPKLLYCRGLEDLRISKEAIARLNTWLQSKTKAITKTYAGLGHSVDQQVMLDVAEYVNSQLG
ncbi:MAG: alpha/beta fold hydrolase [Microbacteriaceae bacterium]|nr:alpha/beta fold hydrolase [Microbacteriaceae bacterium]